MALQVDHTDPTTGAQYQGGYVKLLDAHLTVSTNYVDATFGLFYNAQTAAAGKNPVIIFPTFTLSPDEVNTDSPAFVLALAGLVQAGQIKSPEDALKACLYVLFKPRFPGSVDV